MRHNLKTHLNICGFSELLCEEIEDFSDDDLAKKAALLEALETIRAKGDDIVRYIERLCCLLNYPPLSQKYFV